MFFYRKIKICLGGRSNGKRHGKGKEYYDGTLIFEGEYLNDKEWIGNRYDWNGNILYTLNNNINGNGKEYYDGKLFFEGEYLNGFRERVTAPTSKPACLKALA